MVVGTGRGKGCSGGLFEGFFVFGVGDSGRNAALILNTDPWYRSDCHGLGFSGTRFQAEITWPDAVGHPIVGEQQQALV